MGGESVVGRRRAARLEFFLLYLFSLFLFSSIITRGPKLIPLSSLVAMKCTAKDVGGLSNFIRGVARLRVGQSRVAGPLSTVHNHIPKLAVRQKAGKRTTLSTIHLQNAASLADNGSPLVVISKMFNSLGVLASVCPASVRDFAVLGSTSRATRCNSHKTSNIVRIAAGGNVDNGAHIDCGNDFNVASICGGLDVLSTGNFQRITSRQKLSVLSLKGGASFRGRVRRAKFRRGRRITFCNNSSTSDCHISLKCMSQRKIVRGRSVGGFASGVGVDRGVFNGFVHYRLNVFNSIRGGRGLFSCRGAFCSTTAFGPAFPGRGGARANS